MYSAEIGGTEFLPIGLFDLSPGLSSSANCAHPYVAHLLVTSLLPSSAGAGVDSSILQLHSAEVKLMDLRRGLIAFERGDAALPNPFLVPTNGSLPPAKGAQPATGVAQVELIPLEYAAQLRDSEWVGSQILAQIQIFGTTLGGKDIAFRPFVYPIELCDGCLTLCAEKDIADRMLDDAELAEGQCMDNSGQDGRICIDPDC